MKNKTIIFTIIILVIISGALFIGLRRSQPSGNIDKTSSQDAIEAPKFEAFKATKFFAGTPASPDFKTRESALQFKTVIENGAKKGPNFAGAYTVVSWGCGSACQNHAILDAESGKILVFGNDYVTTRDLKFNKESNLIIFDPYDPELNPASLEYDFPARYFVFENGALREIYKESCLMGSGGLECGQLSFGFIRSLSSNAISFDPIEMLSGTIARDQASKDLNCPIDRVEECAPSLNNDYYIRNLDKTAVNFPIDQNTIFSVEANQGSPVLNEVSISEFGNEYSESNNLRLAPFKIMVKNGRVIKIEQQYLP